jgi:hypothetical protein
MRRSLDPRAWIRKYLILASVSWDDCVVFIRGINTNRFNSIAIHINNQFVLDTARTTLKIIDEKISIKYWFTIEIWNLFPV